MVRRPARQGAGAVAGCATAARPRPDQFSRRRGSAGLPARDHRPGHSGQLRDRRRGPGGAGHEQAVERQRHAAPGLHVAAFLAGRQPGHRVPVSVLRDAPERAGPAGDDPGRRGGRDHLALHPMVRREAARQAVRLPARAAGRGAVRQLPRVAAGQRRRQRLAGLALLRADLAAIGQVGNQHPPDLRLEQPQHRAAARARRRQRAARRPVRGQLRRVLRGDAEAAAGPVGLRAAAGGGHAAGRPGSDRAAAADVRPRPRAAVERRLGAGHRQRVPRVRDAQPARGRQRRRATADLLLKGPSWTPSRSSCSPPFTSSRDARRSILPLSAR